MQANDPLAVILAVAPAVRIEAMQEGVWAVERRALTVGLVATVTLVAFEALAVGTVMPLVARDLGGLELYGWAFSAFFLGNLVGIVATGGAIDRGGLRGPFAVGLVLFGIGLLVGGLATSMPMLVFGRLVQGAGAGAVPATAYVTIRRAYPAIVRPRMFAIMSTAWVVPGLLGPAIAGWIGDHLTWRVVFLGLLPLIVVAALPALLALRGVPDHRAGSSGDDVAGDAPTAADPTLHGDRARLVRALLVAGGAGLLLAATTAPSAVVGIILAVTGLAIGVPALTGLLPVGTLRAAPGLPTSVLLRGFLTFAFFGMQAYLPLALIEVRGTSATEAGVALTVATLSWTAGSWVQAHRQVALGPRRLVAAGFALIMLSAVTTAFVLLPSVPIAVAAATWGVAGFGMGLAYSSIALLVLAEAHPRQVGFATSALNLSDVVGTSVGTGAGGAVIAIAAAAGGSAAAGIGLAFGLSMLVAAGGLFLSRRLTPGSGAAQRQAASAETA
jgi:MFS family permease